MHAVQGMAGTDGRSPELARENLFQPNMDDAKPNNNNNNNNNINSNAKSQYGDCSSTGRTMCSIENQPMRQQPTTPASAAAQSATAVVRKRNLSSSNLVNDLEILDRELSAINAPMLLIDPEITQGAEQLEKASLSASRKRMRSNSISEDESDRAGASMDSPNSKRNKLSVDHHHHHHLELDDFDMNQNQKDFEVIMDALRLGTPTSPSGANDSCGQAAMLSESASVFHNLVVTSLET
ncbi:serine/threonine-protein kinase pakA [Drosophila miranda]|uniref:serine/threonine-protein kinase pakA n=1 Tax=Drosophila miranda TaxID=7229 RepID=UPI00143F616E|nr:serine/threonine-protein kinase pakA [Drosophila miranda]